MLQTSAVPGPNKIAGNVATPNAATNDEELTSHHTTININQAQAHSIIVSDASAAPNSINPEIQTSEEAVLRHPPEVPEIDESNVDFSLNKEQWQRRANSQSHIKVTPVKQNRHSEPFTQRQSHTPDLVMDLPLVGNCSPQETKKKSISVSANLYSEGAKDPDTLSVKSVESPTDPESPDMTTAAETFAKQNQCTLKKNTKLSDTSVYTDNNKSDLIAITSPAAERKCTSLLNNSSTTTFKPQVKSKPPLLKKPVFSVSLNNTPIRKDQDSLPT